MIETELRNALESHLEETRGHVSRLEQVFEMHGEEAKKQKCKGMQGVLEEGDEMVGKDATPVVRDAAIISACRRVEHYEIAAYGTVRTYAEQMGQQRAAAVLQETLDRKSLDQANLKEVSVSQDRDKGVVTLGGRVTNRRLNRWRSPSRADRGCVKPDCSGSAERRKRRQNS
jgi:ferritin-like metal-binding protein YciE